MESKEEPFPRQPRKSPPQAEASPEEQAEELQRQALHQQAEDLQALLASPGWPQFSKIIDEVMAEAAKEADEGEGVAVYRAQGKKQALREINSRVNEKLEILRRENEDGSEEG